MSTKKTQKINFKTKISKNINDHDHITVFHNHHDRNSGWVTFIILLIIVILAFIFGWGLFVVWFIILIFWIALIGFVIDDNHQHHFINHHNHLLKQEKIDPDDELDMGLGQPEFFKPFVQTNILGNEQRVKDVDSLYFLDEPIELKSNIRRLHEEFPVCDTKSDLVISNGSIQLLTAYCWSVKQHIQSECNCDHKISIFYQKPGPDFLYRGIAKVAGIKVIENFDDLASINPEHLIEIVNTPNNPNNKIQKSITDAKWKIFDMVYSWPHFMDKEDFKDLIKNPIQDNCIFSASKLFGLAGSRTGWGFIKDQCLVSLIKEYIFNSTLNWSRDGLNRTNTALISLFHPKTFAKSYFKDLRKIVVNRHEELSKKLTLLNKPGAYAWVQKDVKDFAKLNIIVESGENFGVSNDFSRINLMASNAKFEELLRRLC